MQMQQPVLPAQQAGTPTAMQAQNPVMPVQQAAGMQQAMVMQMQQPPSLTMPQSLMSVQQQAVMPPGQQSAIMHGHQPTTLQLKSHQQQQQAGGVGTPLSNIKDSGWVKYMMKVYYYRVCPGGHPACLRTTSCQDWDHHLYHHHLGLRWQTT